jgi:hypothetical protein
MCMHVPQRMTHVNLTSFAHSASWPATVSDTMLTMRDRLKLCLSACRLVAYLRDQNMIYTDFQPAALGIDADNYVVKLQDVDAFKAERGATRCDTNADCRPAWLADPPFDELTELNDFGCDISQHKCRLQDHRINMFAVCHVVIEPLLRAHNPLLASLSTRFKVALDTMLHGM